MRPHQIDGETTALLRNQYVQAVAADKGTSEAVKIAMVMGAYYESSYKHIGTPYVDKLGKGQPLTVCNGITGPQVVQGRYYTPADCYRLERARSWGPYIAGEKHLKWPRCQHGTPTPSGCRPQRWTSRMTTKAQRFDGSTMRRKLLAQNTTGDVVGACRENVRWNRAP